MMSLTTNASPFDIHWSHYPRSYLAPKLPTDPVWSLINNIDGDLTKDVWSQAPWSEYFDDIRGSDDAPPSDRPNSSCTTRFKMLWDDDYLYVGAILTSDFTTTATFHDRNSPIFQQDSDFEVFLDPIGSCHNYKEFEVNALNTVWNLMLDKPYDDGGREHSGRIAHPGDDMYYEVYHQKSATRVIQGQLNDPNHHGTTWSVEMAFAHSDTLSNYNKNNKNDSDDNVAKDQYWPKVGNMWRINFSRVEKRGDINWTWQPQIVWDAAKKRYAGVVKMHLPDAWGYLVFGNEQPQQQQHYHGPQPRDPSWPARLAAANLYYGQQEYQRKMGVYADNVQDLAPWLDPDVMRPFGVHIQRKPGSTGSNKIDSAESYYEATIAGNPDGRLVTISNDRCIVVRPKKCLMEPSRRY